RLNSLGAGIRRVEDCAENVPASLRLTQPVASASSLSETSKMDTTVKLDDGRQLRIDGAENVAPTQPAADPKAKHGPNR
ncbi:MAG: hypothetical protein ACI93T_000560, partial [Porticoccaceae bacterium]